jgi:hypothetical protein
VGQATRHGCLLGLAEDVESGLGVAAVERNGAVSNTVLYSSFNCGSVARCKGRALSSTDSAGAERSGVCTTIGLASWEAVWGGADRKSVLCCWTRHFLLKQAIRNAGTRQQAAG